MVLKKSHLNHKLPLQKLYQKIVVTREVRAAYQTDKEVRLLLRMYIRFGLFTLLQLNTVFIVLLLFGDILNDTSVVEPVELQALNQGSALCKITGVETIATECTKDMNIPVLIGLLLNTNSKECPFCQEPDHGHICTFFFYVFQVMQSVFLTLLLVQMFVVVNVRVDIHNYD